MHGDFKRKRSELERLNYSKNYSNVDWTPLLMEWYSLHKRDLPWRSSFPRDPYKVWVAEAMLQQTRVEAVKSYYTNWMEHFPDIPFRWELAE